MNITKLKQSVQAAIKNKKIVIPAAIAGILIAGGVFGFVQYSHYQTKQNIINTHNLLVTYLEEVEDVDKQVNEFEELNSLDESNYKTAIRRFEDEYKQFNKELEEVKQARLNLQEQIEKNDAEALDEYNELILEIDRLTYEEYETMSKLLSSTQKYATFFAEIYGSDAFSGMDDAETEEEVLNQLAESKKELEDLRSQLVELKDEEYYQDINTSFDELLSAMITFTDDISMAIKNKDFSGFENALISFAESMEQLEDLDLYEFEKVIDESDERIEEINELYDEVRAEEKDLIKIYNIDTKEDNLKEIRFEKAKYDGFIQFGESKQNEPVEAYEL
ncbi:MAG: hypothetical protein ACOCXQ_04120 [Patescibacteria group bacterium]